MVVLAHAGICCSLNLDFFIEGFLRPVPAKPNREFLTKNGPIRRAQVRQTRRRLPPRCRHRDSARLLAIIGLNPKRLRQ